MLRSRPRAGWILWSFVLGLLGFPPASPGGVEAEDDVAAARALFEANLEAIRNRDRQAYLECYAESDGLVRSGPEGISLGFGPFAAGVGDPWPDVFEAQDLRLVPVSPGWVYGTYRYRVRYGNQEVAGLSERFFHRTGEGWRIAVTTAFPAPSQAPPPPLALVGATLVNGTGAPPIADAVVLVRDGRVECAGSRQDCPLPQGSQTKIAEKDLSDRWITPGLVDAHVHFSQTGWADGRPDSLDVRPLYPYAEVQAGLRARPERWLRSYLCSGVTAVFDVGGYPWTWSLKDRTENDSRAPHVGAAGPLLSTLDFWLNLPAERQFIYLADADAAKPQVEYLVSHGTDAVKVWFIPVRSRPWEDMESAVLAAGEAARHHEVPLIVHATGLREAKVAVRAGAHLLVHSVWDQPVDQEFIDLAKKSGTLYCPTLKVRSGYMRMYQSAHLLEPPLVDDPNNCVDDETKKRLAETARLGNEIDLAGINAELIAAQTRRGEQEDEIGAENLRRLHKAGVTIAMGTDAGNPLTLHGPSVYAEMEAMQAAGLTPMEVLVASTRGGAKALRRERDLGTLEKGKIADLLVLAADPTSDITHLRQLLYVMRGGVLRSIDELKK